MTNRDGVFALLISSVLVPSVGAPHLEFAAKAPVAVGTHERLVVPYAAIFYGRINKQHPFSAVSSSMVLACELIEDGGSKVPTSILPFGAIH